MGFIFKLAVRESVGLIIAVAGGTGSGKTFSAMRLAKGICGDKPFAVIDTESGRALHYADQFRFDHGDLRAPFNPDSYFSAISAADASGYPVIVIDSFSHEHAGEGGILDMHETELDRMAGDNYGKREACKMAAWIKPKMEHKKLMQKLLQVRAHIIMCFRAEEKIEIAKDQNGKTIIVPKKTLSGINGWVPICEKNIPYEATCSFLVMADRPGIPIPIKLQEQHKQFFDLSKPLDDECGRKLSEWAAGGSTPKRSDSSSDDAKEAAICHEAAIWVNANWSKIQWPDDATRKKVLARIKAKFEKPTLAELDAMDGKQLVGMADYLMQFTLGQKS